MREIDVIAWFDHEGNITPLKFKIPSDGQSENISVKIDQVLEKTKDKFAGNTMIVFECQSIVNETLKRYQIKYEVEKHKWYLHKIT